MALALSVPASPVRRAGPQRVSFDPRIGQVVPVNPAIVDCSLLHLVVHKTVVEILDHDVLANIIFVIVFNPNRILP